MYVTGLEASERLSTPDSHRKKKSRFIEDEEENMCEVCRQNLYVALVSLFHLYIDDEFHKCNMNRQ